MILVLDTELRRAYKPISAALAEFEKHLRQELDHRFPFPSFLLRGKRLRPASVFFTSRSFDGTTTPAMRAALAVEMLHAGSLVHDDIVDNSLQRRGSETLHVRFGLVDAVLAGDSLFLKSLAQINAIRDPDLMAEFLHTCQAALEGEQMEEQVEDQDALSREVYFKIISLKTAELFATSFGLGSKLAGDRDESTKRIRAAGWSFGMAYQIIDDCEDFSPNGDGDLAAGKFTLPVIEAAEKSPGLRQALLSGRFKPGEVFDAVNQEAGLGLALEHALRHLEAARQSLQSAGLGSELEPLEEFFSYLELRASAIPV